MFKFLNKVTSFVHFIHHEFVQFIDPQKAVHRLMKIFVHFNHIPI